MINMLPPSLRRNRFLSSIYWRTKSWQRARQQEWQRRKQEARLDTLAKLNKERKGRIKQTNAGRVFVVVNIDTEGPSSSCKNPTWAEVEREVTDSLLPEFRNKFLDSNKKPFVLSWYIVDWVGANTSTRGRDIGYHKIFDRYQPFIEQAKEYGYEDEVYWHYHHIYQDRLESSNNKWFVFPQYEEILTRMILDRHFFPPCYRAGNTWEDNDSSSWLEQWFPFDFSSRSPYKGFNYDWSNAISDWRVYHPNANNYQTSGELSRWIARSLSIENGWFRRAEVESAFLDAAEGRDAYVSFFTHDYRAMCDYIAEGLSIVQEVASEYPQVEIKHANALETFRSLTKCHTKQTFRLTLEKNETAFLLSANLPLQGQQPWLAVCDEKGKYKRLDAQTESPLKWVVPFSSNENVSALAAAAAATDGQTYVLRIL
jgi:hypothetical protein